MFFRSEMGLGGQESTTAEYVCQLPEGSRKVALEELREDDAIREQSLAQMRDWIDKNVNIKNCRTGKLILYLLTQTRRCTYTYVYYIKLYTCVQPYH